MDIAFVYAPLTHSAVDDRPGHPAHQGFQDTVGAATVTLEQPSAWGVPGTALEDLSAALNSDVPAADVYVLENVNALYAAPGIQRAHPESTVLCLAAHGVFGLDSYCFDDDVFKRWIRRFDRKINHRAIHTLLNRVDGILAISEYVAEYVADHCSTPVTPVYPYIQPGLFTQLQDLPIHVGEPGRVVTVCEARDHKGVDLLVKAWPKIRETHPGAELHVIGEGHPDAYETTAGVHVRGFVDDLVAEYERAELYVHPARQDAFGVTVVEAMLAGTVPVVTRTTGAREEVARVDEQLLTHPTSDALAATVEDALAAPMERQRNWLTTARERAGHYNEATKTTEFVEKFETLLARVK